MTIPRSTRPRRALPPGLTTTFVVALLGLGGMAAAHHTPQDPPPSATPAGSPASPGSDQVSPAPDDNVLVAVAAAETTSSSRTRVTRRARPTPLPPEAAVADPDRGLVYRGLRRATEGPCVGLFELDRIPEECTHGPDALPPGADVDRNPPPLHDARIQEQLLVESSGTSGTGAELGATATAAVPCVGDGASGNRVQVLYVHASGGTDRYATYLDSFRTWAAGIDTIYDESARETGGNRHVRFVTERVGDSCVPTVTKVAVSSTALTTFTAMNKELQAQGFSRTDRKYVVFADSKIYCGIGTFSGDTRKGASNRSNVGPSYGRTDTGCWGSQTPAHELGHNLGAVNNNAPNSSGSGHCVDEYDIMCYSDAPRYPSMVTKCSSRSNDSRMDCNHDDYFNTDPTPGSYLANNFNVADNVFLVSSGEVTSPPATSSSSPSATRASPTATVSPSILTTPGRSPSASPSRTPSTPVVTRSPSTTTPRGSTTPPTVPPTSGPRPGTSPGTTSSPCVLRERYTGRLRGTGSGAYQPNGGYYYASRRSVHQACLSGPSGTDFDLYLSQWTGSSWREVARSTSLGSSERVSHSAGRGFYRWTVRSARNGGSYVLTVGRG